jgi:membrane-bound lytic murein transglycosylase B
MKIVRLKLVITGILMSIFMHPVYALDKVSLKKYHQEIEKIITALEVKHKVSPDYSRKVISSIKFREKSLISMNNAAERKKTWEEYEKIFLTSRRINSGREYYKKNYNILKEVEDKYGVPSEIIVSFLGVETNYGKGTGKIKVLDSLGTLALQHPRRGKFFKQQLIYFIVLTYKNNLNYEDIYGSYAGAMGVPQFMPESFIKKGVDYNNDGKIDLWNDKYDIYASVANYLKKNGWQKDKSIYSNVIIKDNHLDSVFKDGDRKTRFIKNEDARKILKIWNVNSGKKYLILLSKENRKYKMGYKNFKVIMSYNPSTFYAMIVTELSKKIVAK